MRVGSEFSSVMCSPWARRLRLLGWVFENGVAVGGPFELRILIWERVDEVGWLRIFGEDVVTCDGCCSVYWL
jgi:hypothetical protein